MSYDHWKTTNPADEFLGPDPDDVDDYCPNCNQMSEAAKQPAIPEFIRGWTAPFHVTMDGIKDANGCWICSAASNALAHKLVELMNFAAHHAALAESTIPADRKE